MPKIGLSRRAFVGAALSFPAVCRARADCSTPQLRVRVSRDFETFDPADAYGSDAAIARNILAPLVRYKRRAAQTGPWDWERHIVENITQADRRSYKFKLRDEDWERGAPVSCADVAFSFSRIRAGGSVNAANQRLWSNLRSVDVVDETSGVIRLVRDDDQLLTTALPSIAGCVVDKAYVTGLSGGRFALDPGPTTGRYELCTVARGDRVLLKRDQSWKGDPPEVESAAFIVIKDDNTAQQAFRDGLIDLYEASPDELQIPEPLGNTGYVARATTSRVVHLVLSQRGPLENPQLRQAVQLSIDRARISRSAYGVAEPIIPTGLIPQGWEGWLSERYFDFQPDEAKQLAASSRIPDPLRIFTLPGVVRQKISARVADDLAAIGVPATVLVINDPTELCQGYAMTGPTSSWLLDLGRMSIKPVCWSGFLRRDMVGPTGPNSTRISRPYKPGLHMRT
ncbi:ABC transporter substrate-binding protein [Mesorhizobium sp. BR1-1-7]|nr:ABC transporter substrate-binding protein [Mesorhizobium sp. BR1-1-7]MBZ9922284.1 ABC transporter substrate-binding protein [Mesorhizobium sp. BR1-1-7]